MITATARSHPELRDGVRAVIADVDSRHCQEMDETRAFPEAFDTALTEAGWLSADISWEAANVCLQTHRGFGFAAEHNVERKFRETWPYRVVPISANFILCCVGGHAPGMPRSYRHG